MLEIKRRKCPHCGVLTKTSVLTGAQVLTADEENSVKSNNILLVQFGDNFKCSGCGQEIKVLEDED